MYGHWWMKVEAQLIVRHQYLSVFVTVTINADKLFLDATVIESPTWNLESIDPSEQNASKKSRTHTRTHIQRHSPAQTKTLKRR